MDKLLSAFLVLCFAGCLVVGCGGDDPGSVDTGDPGDDADNIPPAVVTDLHGASPTATSIALVWTAPGDDNMSGRATEYDIRYFSSPITEQNWDAATQIDYEPAPKPAGEGETFRVLELDPATVYHFALKTSDEVPNTSALSNSATDTTKQETVPPGIVTDLKASAVDTLTFLLTWTAPGDDYASGTASEYDVRYSTSPITEQNWDAALQASGEPQPKPAGQPETFTFTVAQAATHYYFALKTADEVPNWSSISHVFVELEYGRSLWAWPRTIDVNSENTVTNILYRVTAEEPISLILQYLPVGVRADTCGTRGWDVLDPVTSPIGTYMMTYDFAGKITYGMRLYLALCHDSQFVDEILIQLLL